jgi:hypothetical protein
MIKIPLSMFRSQMEILEMEDVGHVNDSSSTSKRTPEEIR